MRAWLIALGLGGCSFSAAPSSGPVDGSTGGGDPDTAIDTPPIDTKVEQVCVGTFVRVCVDAPQVALTLLTQTINTSSSTMCVAANPAVNACVITGQSITIPPNSRVTVIGGKPLILLSTSAITIAGVLDASSGRDQTGPAADTGPCLTNSVPPMGAGGGGWGGSFGGPGSNGGTSAVGGIGGIAAPANNATALTGGCPGGKGAGNGIGQGAGDGGHSGGGVYLLAEQAITIGGTVNASGRGGGGGDGLLGAGGGGGGGGSGGMIVLEAAAVRVPGKCYANGGGGGEGSNFGDGSDGNGSSAPDRAGSGGRGVSTGGDGGDSAFADQPPRGGANGSIGNKPAPGDGGGGGGGGGAGFIKVIAPDQQDTDDTRNVSPTPR